MEEQAKREFQHERNTPLPNRVRDGQFEDDVLILQGAEIPWDDVQFMALGVIDQVVKDADGPKGVFRKMMGKVMGKEEQKQSGSKDRSRQVREVYLLDMVVAGYDQVFRLDSGSINYRQFLDEVGYVSLHNFYRFCVHLARRATKSRIDASLEAFLGRRRESLKHYAAFYDFELEMQNMAEDLEAQTPQSELDLSRDSWVEEWSDW